MRFKKILIKLLIGCFILGVSGLAILLLINFVQVIIKPEPTYLGDKIDIHGDGNVTND